MALELAGILAFFQVLARIVPRISHLLRCWLED